MRFSFSIILLPVLALHAQPADRSPPELIRFLKYESDDRRGKPMTFSCGMFRTDWDATKALASLGAEALPFIEEELDLFEERGERNLGAGPVLAAYVGIKGHDALPRIDRMRANAKLSFFSAELDAASAFALGITSYVSSSETLVRILSCDHGGEPRHALNKLILAWEKNDRDALESTLGPGAKAALGRLLRSRTWSRLRREMWRENSTREVAVGYNFEGDCRWSEPEMTLDYHRDNPQCEFDYDRPEFKTQFKNRAGGECGELKIQFIATPVIHTRPVKRDEFPYLVDSPDLVSLLRAIGTCAAQ